MSLKKIAEMTGVSPSTVSRVLNNTSSTCASREVRDRIFAAAREIGYQPNEHARSLRSSQAQKETRRHVSIVLARITTVEADPFFYELFRELEITLFQNDIVIDHVVYAEENLSRDVTRSHGVIILGRCSQKLFRQIMDANRNVVAIWRNTMDFDVDEVVCDGRKAAELAMNHLISLGHRNIAYIGDCSAATSPSTMTGSVRPTRQRPPDGRLLKNCWRGVMTSPRCSVPMMRRPSECWNY